MIYQRLLAPVRLKCRRILGQTEEAEGVAQESFVRLMQSGPRWVDESDTPVLMDWIYKTSTRLCIDLIRRRREISTSERDDRTAGRGRHASMEHALAARRLLSRVNAHATPVRPSAFALDVYFANGESKSDPLHHHIDQCRICRGHLSMLVEAARIPFLR